MKKTMKKWVFDLSIIAFIALMMVGCITFLEMKGYDDAMAYIRDCADKQVELYSDLCSESSTGYEDMSGQDAHFEGVKCAAQSIRWCTDE